VVLQGAGERLTSPVGGFEHHERLRLDEPVGVRPSHHRGLEHVGMRAQRAFDLERRDIVAADLHHVVAASAIDKKAVLVFEIFVARAGPFPQKGRARLLAIVPIHDGAGRPAHLQFADLALLHQRAGVVHELDVIAWNRLAGGAVFDLAGPVRQVGLEHFGRAEAVENVDPVALAPAPADMRRQGLAGRDAKPKLHLAGLRRRRAGEETRIERRHAVEHRDRVP